VNDYIFVMHDDARGAKNLNWEPYLAGLWRNAQFNGGSAIGGGECCSKLGSARDITGHLSGFIRVQAESLEDAKRLLDGNPVYEAGGTVEIRELPRG
jgi:hypothetical protein